MPQIEVKIFSVCFVWRTKVGAARAARFISIYSADRDTIIFFLTALTKVNVGCTCASCLATKKRQIILEGIILEIMRSI